MTAKRSRLTRRAFLQSSAAAAALAGGSTARRAHAGPPPNIVFLMTDDQRWDAMGCAGNPIIQTPHLDQLAREGTRIGNCFSSTPICSCSRASILTGLHTRVHGVEDFATPLSPETWQLSYPHLLREAGYQTAFVGKWGIGGNLPEDAFDYWEGFGGQGRYFPEDDGETTHLTSVLGGQAIGFLEQVQRDRPFCLSVSFKAPHVQDDDPRQFLYDPALEHLYQDATIPPPDAEQVAARSRWPEWLREHEGRERWKRRFSNDALYQQMVKGYYRLVSGVDREVGRIRKALAERGLAENTVIMFTSDQGFFLGEYGLAGKWLLFEDSIRMPLIIHDPRVAADGRVDERPAIRHEMAMNIDLAPTLLSLAGIGIPASMQGMSLAPLLSDEKPAWRDICFFEHHFANDPEGRIFIPGSQGIRTRRYKYIRYDHGQPPYEQLFDLARDPKEIKNLASESGQRGLLAMMREQFEAARTRAWKQDAAQQPSA